MTRRQWLATAFFLSGCGRSEGPFPSREIKLVVQSTPGGLSDIVSRVMASQMEKSLAVPVVCENKPGAAGALAFSYVTRREPDGYTIGHGPVEIAMVRSLGFAQVGPDDMDLLCLVSKTQPVLAVHVEAPWPDFEAFVEAVRRQPGYCVMANSGTGSIWHINALLLEEAMRLELVHCPFGGSAGALTALLGKHVDAAVAGAGEAAPHVASGRLRVLAVFDSTRSSLFPDVPAVSEFGHDFGASAWSGFYAPLGLPPDRRDRHVRAMREAFDSEAFQRVCRERGMEPAFLDPSGFRQFAREQAAFFSAAIPRLLGGQAD